MKIRRIRALPVMVAAFLAVFSVGCATAPPQPKGGGVAQAPTPVQESQERAREIAPMQETQDRQKQEESPEWLEQVRLIGEIFERLRVSSLYDIDFESCTEAMLGAISQDLNKTRAREETTEISFERKRLNDYDWKERMCLDQFSKYMSPEEVASFDESMRGSFEGIGLELTEGEKGVETVRSIEGQPAFKAGFLPGDIVVAVREKGETESMTVENLNHAVKMIRGEKGTAVVITVLRVGKEMEIEVVRAVIETSTVREAKLVGDVGYVRLTAFKPDSGDDFEAEVKTLNIPGPYPRLIVDVRENGGGALPAVQEISYYFSDDPKDVTVTLAGKGGKKLAATSIGSMSPSDMRRGYFVYPDTREPKYPGVFKDYRVVVLIDAGSASASEILAGVLKDWGAVHGRFVLVGEPTFGKGVVQTMYPLSNGGRISVTTSQYLVGNNETPVHEIGVMPDYVVKDTRTKMKDGRQIFDWKKMATDQDAQYVKALEVLRAMPEPDLGEESAGAYELVVFMKTDKGWKQGDELPDHEDGTPAGWGARVQPSKDACMERKQYAHEEFPGVERGTHAFVCVPSHEFSVPLPKELWPEFGEEEK